MAVVCCGLVTAQEVISLVGSWDLSVGDSTHYDDYVMLPGSLQTNGKTVSLEKGMVWYKKSVYIPRDWKRQRVTLFLERPLTETLVFVNGHYVGQEASKYTPHQYDVTPFMVPGQRNTVAICVVGQERNGITGRMELCAQSPRMSIKRVKINPEPVNGELQLTVELDCAYNPLLYYEDMSIVVMSQDKDNTVSFMANEDITSTTMNLRIPIGKVFRLWDEFVPQIYQIGIRAGDDYYETSFGVRTVKAEGRRLSINGRPLWLRGIVGDGCFAQTDYPPTDEVEWTEVFSKMKEYGLNHMRFRTYCPPDAAFAVADKLGVYLLLEGTMTPEELKGIADTYGHHPSLVMMASGEAGGGWELPMIACGQEPEGLQLCYKQEIERHLLTKDYAGFLLPTLSDCTHISAEDWREFCSPLVPLARFPKTDYTTADTLRVPVEVYNALYGNVSPIRKSYLITNGDQVVTGGALANDSLPMDRNTQIGSIVYPLDTISRPSTLTLTVKIGKTVWNHWDFRVTPVEATKEERP